MKYKEVNKEIGIYIMEAINAGICADVSEMLEYSDSNTHRHIFTSTDGYDLEKTIQFITEAIRNYNRASKQHSSRK